MALASPKPFPYQDPYNQNLHRGIAKTSTAGVVTVDLGIGHNFFVPTVTLKGGATELANGYSLAWDYGSKKGTFVVTVFKRPASYGAWIAATVAVNLSFTAIAGSAVSL